MQDWKKSLTFSCPNCGSDLTLKLSEPVRMNSKFNERICSLIEAEDLNCQKCRNNFVITINWRELEPELRAI